MKASVSLLAVFMVLSCPSFGQAPQTQQTAADASKPEAASQQAAAAEEPVAAVSVGDVPTTPAFRPGAKLYIQPMNGFEERLAYSLTKKKVPVVLEKDREKADFVLTGGAHVHKRGFFTGFVLSTNGKGSVWIEDARTGKQLWLYKFHAVAAMETVDQNYQDWADSVAGHLKKTMVKMEKK